MSTMKRLYFYGVALVALVVAAIGASLLLTTILDQLLGRRLGGTLGEQVAPALAMVIVAAPLWLVHWGWAQRQAQREPGEAGAVLRKLYVYLALGIAVTVAFFAARGLLRWALAVEPWDSPDLSLLVVWGGVWAYHWSMEQREGQPSVGARTVRRWYVYVVSLYSLVALGAGVAGALAILLGQAYDGLVGTSFMASAGLLGEPLRNNVAGALVGGAWWAAHWLVLARGDVESTLRQVYLYLFAFLGGALTVLISLAFMLNAVLQWLLGAPAAEPAAAQFRVFPRMLPTLVVGLALLGYHWGVMQDETRILAGRRPGARRSFGYIMAALGLGALATGVSLFFTAILALVVPDVGGPLVGQGEWRNALAMALTLVLVGGPLWAVYWSRMQRAAERGGVEERSALSRRIFIYGVLGVLALAVLGSVIGLLALLLQDLLEARLTLDFLREGRGFVGVAITTGAFIPYYWQVLREDQRAGAEAAPARKGVLLVVAFGAEELVRRMEEALDARVQVLRVVAPETTAPAPSDEELAALAQQVRDAPTERVLVLATEGAVRVLSYR